MYIYNENIFIKDMTYKKLLIVSCIKKMKLI